MTPKQKIFIAVGSIAILFLLGIGGVFLFRGMKTGDMAADVRKQYSRKIAGVKPSTPADSKAPTTSTVPPLPTTPVPPIQPPGNTGFVPPELDPAKRPTNEYTARPDRPDTVPSLPSGSNDTDAALMAPAPQYQQPLVPDVLLSPKLPNGRSRNGEGGGTAVGTVDPRRYLFNNQAAEATAGRSLVETSNEEAVQVDINSFAPMGESIEIAFMDNAATVNTEIDVAAAVWQPFYFQGNKILDVGDKLLGRAAPGKNRDRMVIKFYKIIFKDGKSLSISAVAQDVDGTYGVKGHQVGDAVLQSMTPILLEMAAAFTESFKRPAINSFIPNTRVGFGGATISANDPSADLADSGYSAVQGGMDKISSLLAEDIEENKPYLVVPAGTRARAYLQNWMDASQRDYAK